MTNTNELPALLPCPFCGGEAAALKNDRGAWAQIQCVSCGARSCEHPDDFQLVARAWNRRARARMTRVSHESVTRSLIVLNVPHPNPLK